MVHDRAQAVEDDSHHEAELGATGQRLRKLTCLNRTRGSSALIGYHIFLNNLPIGHSELLQAHKKAHFLALRLILDRPKHQVVDLADDHDRNEVLDHVVDRL